MGVDKSRYRVNKSKSVTNRLHGQHIPISLRVNELDNSIWATLFTKVLFEYLRLYVCFYEEHGTFNMIFFLHKYLSVQTMKQIIFELDSMLGLACRRDQAVPDRILTYDGETTRGSKLITYTRRRRVLDIRRGRGGII